MSDKNMPDEITLHQLQDGSFDWCDTKFQDIFTGMKVKYIRADLAPTQSVDVDLICKNIIKNNNITVAASYSIKWSVEQAVKVLEEKGYLRTPEPTTYTDPDTIVIKRSELEKRKMPQVGETAYQKGMVDGKNRTIDDILKGRTK